MSPRRVLQTRPQRTGRQPSRPIRSRHEALGHQPPLSPHFLPYMGGPARAIKPFPALTDSTDSFSPADSPADSLCFTDPPHSLAYPPPGVLPESDCPIKGLDQRSVGVAPSSRGVSYIWGYWGSWRKGDTPTKTPTSPFRSLGCSGTD